MRLGIIARCDDTGLGNQTLELTKMLDPDKVMLIDSSPFHFYNKQYPERYENYNVSLVKGMPTKRDVAMFLKHVDVIISCEIFYNNDFIDIARRMGKKTILQYNFEFLDNIFNPNLPLPDVLLAPSIWRINEVEEKFGNKTRVMYLPPPTDEINFSKNRNINAERHNRLLHIVGKRAVHDRNGTESVISMMKYLKSDVELVIRSQFDLGIPINDDRIAVVAENMDDKHGMYSGYDAMVLPRRYAGLCLPMNEALMSGLPVFMTDVSPNNALLPKSWLARSNKIGEFMTRAMLDIYEADPEHLAFLVDAYISRDMTEDKEQAYVIGFSNFSTTTLKPAYKKLLDNLANS